MEVPAPAPGITNPPTPGADPDLGGSIGGD